MSFWAISLGAALVGLLACRRWAHLALVVVPVTTLVPLLLARATGPEGPRFQDLQDLDLIGASAMVFVADVVGMVLGKWKFVYYSFFPGPGPDPSKARAGDDPPGGITPE